MMENSTVNKTKLTEIGVTIRMTELRRGFRSKSRMVTKLKNWVQNEMTNGHKIERLGPERADGWSQNSKIVVLNELTDGHKN